MTIRILASAAAMLMAAVTAHAQQAAENRDTVHFPISCSEVQGRFDHALALLHNFAYPDTVKAFQAIGEADPDCAMAYWGLAIGEMPNPLSPPFPPGNLDAGWAAIQKGKAAKTQTPRETKYLAAVEALYRDYDKLDHHTRALRYEQAMQRLHEQYPDDSEAAIFYALALNMAVDFSDRTYSRQLKAAAILNDEAKKQPNHPGIAHYLIHAYDFAPLAALCVSTAQHYDKLAPASAHALHMPSHIYSLLGMWDDSIRSNLAAKAAIEANAGKDFNPAWEAHLLDFLVYAYLQEAKDGEAKRIVDFVPKPNQDSFFSLTIDTALAAIPARYPLDRGRWDEAMRLPVGDSAYPAARSITYFARALGAARSGNSAAARGEISHLDDIERQLTSANDDYWAGQTRIQRQAAAAWVMFADGQHDAAIAAMRSAADQDDAAEKTVAMENKLVPIRALLGEAYLAAGRNEEALAEFEISLKVMPNRFRTMAGAAAAARAVGSTGAAKDYSRALLQLAESGDGDRPELSQARAYVGQR